MRPIVFWSNAYSQKYWIYTYVMNKKGLFLFLCLFVFLRFFSHFPFPHLTLCLRFLLSLSHALHSLFFATVSRLELCLGQMIFWVCTSPMNYQAKLVMPSLLLIFLLSWPSLINITKEDLLHVAARCNSLHLSMIGDWGDWSTLFAIHSPTSLAGKTWFPFPSLRHSS